jgi:hypothetical protein
MADLSFVLKTMILMVAACAAAPLVAVAAYVVSAGF